MEPTLEEMLDSLDDSSSIITKRKPGSPADSNDSEGPNATEPKPRSAGSNDPEGPNAAEPKPDSPAVSDDSEALTAALVEALTGSLETLEKTCDKPAPTFMPKPSRGAETAQWADSPRLFDLTSTGDSAVRWFSKARLRAVTTTVTKSITAL